MNKLGVLLRAQLLGMFGINKARYSHDPKEKRKMIAFALLMVFAGVSILFTIVLYDWLFFRGFQQIGHPEMLPALMMAIASLITLLTTIFKVNGILFGFKDYDMTMSLPVKTEIIVASRLLILYLMNVGFCALFLIPAGVIYAIFVPVAAWWFYPILILLTIAVPFVPMIVGTAIGTLVTAVASRFRHMNLVGFVLAMVATLAFVAASFNTQALFTNAAVIGTTLMNAVNGIYPLAGMYARALCREDVVSLLLFLLLSVGLFAGFAWVTARFFKVINTSLTTSRTNGHFKMTALKVSTPLTALYKRELRRYFSSSLYMLNTAFGMVMALVMSGALLFVKPKELEAMLEMPGFAGAFGNFAPLLLVFCVVMTSTTDCAISLEGKSLWILKSMPVPPEVIFRAKIYVNLTVILPLSVVSSLLMALAIPMNGLQILLVFLMPAVFGLLTAEFGLLVNLLFPNLTWVSEVTVIKQSASVMIAVFGGMAFMIAPIVLLVFLPQSAQTLGLAGVTAVVAVVCAILARVLKTKGVRLFRAL